MGREELRERRLIRIRTLLEARLGAEWLLCLRLRGLRLLRRLCVATEMVEIVESRVLVAFDFAFAEQQQISRPTEDQNHENSHCA